MTSTTVAPSTPTPAFSLAKLFGVSGKTVLITGGGSGLGSYAALAFALQGAKVYIVGRRSNKLEDVRQDFIRRQGEATDDVAKQGSISTVTGDVFNKEGVQAIFKQYAEREQHLDVLINGAGVITNNKSIDKNDMNAVIKGLWEQDWNDFTHLFNVNVVAMHYMTTAAAEFLMKAEKPSFESPGPVVLNITSIAGHHISRGASVAYQTSKDAAEKLSKIWAGRLQPAQIRVNAIAPGVFPSEMTHAATPDAYNDPKHPMHPMIASHPLKRSGTVEDFAGVVLFLASRAGAYVNGTSIVIDGGRLLSQSAA